LNQALRDKFVCGIQSQSIRKRLLAEKDLDLQKALQLATGFEERIHKVWLCRKNTHYFYEAHKINHTKKQLFNPPTERLFYRCNGRDHLANTCPYKQFTCQKCKAKGHLAKACRKNKTQTANQIQIEGEQTADLTPEEETEIICMNTEEMHSQ